MATVTPNFNWPVPTSTDLVRDGATAIEALGDSIDGSLVDLKGGTTGQVLSKTSGTDMDFTWVTTDDANAIQNSIVNAKGDLIGASANDTPAILSVGANGETLVADSSTATGLKYVPSFGSTISIQRGTSNQTITANAWTKIQLNDESLDTDGSYDPTTNFRFTPKVAGYYQFNTMIFTQGNVATSTLGIYKNGSFVAAVSLLTNAGPAGIPTIIAANGTTDYFEWYLYSTTNSTVIENRSGGSPTTATWLRGL
jgi:hypothetical protein